MSQGEYGRTLERIKKNYGSYEAAYEYLESKFGDCKDIMDLIMAIEDD